MSIFCVLRSLFLKLSSSSHFFFSDIFVDIKSFLLSFPYCLFVIIWFWLVSQRIFFLLIKTPTISHFLEPKTALKQEDEQNARVLLFYFFRRGSFYKIYYKRWLPAIKWIWMLLYVYRVSSRDSSLAFNFQICTFQLKSWCSPKRGK